MEPASHEKRPIVRGLVHLPVQATLVSDADEEVFLLYTNLARKQSADGTTDFRGLGHIDSNKDILTITFDLSAPEDHASMGNSNPPAPVARATLRGSSKSRRKVDAPVLEVELAQDKTALRSRKGDTGSVVWHARCVPAGVQVILNVNPFSSVDLALLILRQCYHRVPDALLDPSTLRAAHVVELGAGTGLLSVALSSVVWRYTATDIDALVPLIQKNLARNLPTISPAAPSNSKGRSRLSRGHPSEGAPNVCAEALDWTILQNASPSVRQSLCAFQPADLLLVVDCIYHPSLLSALLATIDHLTIAGRTAVLVVVELRAEDVVREFLEGWLGISPHGAWEIWSVPEVLEGPYAVWVGWK
ncbi:hypothetical protein B0H21DRAFT_792119, partial [Amylocystis lapponica]